MLLTGKTIVITRSVAGNKAWCGKLADLGATIYSLPTITTSPIEPSEPLVASIQSLDSFDWVIFTSASGVQHLFLLFKKLNLDASSLKLPKIAVLGPETAAAAAKAGLQVAFVPSVSNSSHLAAELRPLKGVKILLLRTTIASDDLPRTLEEGGARVTDFRLYKTAMITGRDHVFSKLLNSQKVDYVIFASPSAVAGFVARVDAQDFELAKYLPVVAIGPSVAEALHGAGFSSIHTAEVPSLEGIIQVLRRLAV